MHHAGYVPLWVWERDTLLGMYPSGYGREAPWWVCTPLGMGERYPGGYAPPWVWERGTLVGIYTPGYGREAPWWVYQPPYHGVHTITLGIPSFSHPVLVCRHLPDLLCRWLVTRPWALTLE